MLFSQRQGFKPVKQILQIDNMDDDLKISLWNALGVFYWEHVNEPLLVTHDRYIGTRESYILPLLRLLWHLYYKKPLDTLSNSWDIVYKTIRNYFFECPWYEVYDFIEFIATRDTNEDKSKKFIELCNVILEQEMSAYRFVEGHVTKITSEEEIESIEQAIQNPDIFTGASIHLKTALNLLSDRKNPDYRNSIKESISAVEAVCAIICEDQSASLGKALKIIETKTKIELHSALKAAFDKLYGYMSDGDGIRHAMMEESNLKFEDAKFMLVACSAFTNYLKDKNKN
ncbi:hypothetical protein KIAC18_002653 [Sporomusa sphaeroides]|uniref:AbiJ-NTD4 domain-containing protein n=1 Tax=Sporomusa sphaeroides TaxID=47679 RepID=UPI003D9FF78F